MRRDLRLHGRRRGPLTKAYPTCELLLRWSRCLRPISPARAATTVITKDEGGLVLEYESKFSVPRHWVVDGECDSACTMVLGTPDVCATERAVFGFHAAYIPGEDGISPEGTQEMYRHYPKAIQRFVNRTRALTRIIPLTFLKAPEVFRYVPKCPANG